MIEEIPVDELMKALEEESGERFDRGSWDDYFGRLVDLVGWRSTCNFAGRRGCVIVRDNRIVAAGYTGSVSGSLHCDDVGHRIAIIHEEDTESASPRLYPVTCLRSIHAEMNAVYQAARYGIPVDGCTAYVSTMPCESCTMALRSVGIHEVRVVHEEEDKEKP